MIAAECAREATGVERCKVISEWRVKWFLIALDHGGLGLYWNV